MYSCRPTRALSLALVGTRHLPAGARLSSARPSPSWRRLVPMSPHDHPHDHPHDPLLLLTRRVREVEVKEHHHYVVLVVVNIIIVVLVLLIYQRMIQQ